MSTIQKMGYTHSASQPDGTCEHMINWRILMLSLSHRVIVTAVMAIVAWPAFCSPIQSKNNNDPLLPYTTCTTVGNLRAKVITRRSGSGPDYREIATKKAKERVSVIDGYRVMFGYRDVSYYYANVKIEQSDPQSYAHDKALVIGSLKDLATDKQPGKFSTKYTFMDKGILNGFEHYGADGDAIDVGGTVGTHVLFHDPGHVIITVYFLNQEKQGRRFNSIDEYRMLRDTFLTDYTKCLKSASHY
ncbi:hypothetical protein [uncultured Thiodictyon sp.]|uniref:hypothetical protein n=1 Tax=uncultured Thiodictyon sp. TaxID=1846217 RepID=UPI0025D5748C|nr:hypothetical protein [uncultured Thiodictyon sp.]